MACLSAYVSTPYDVCVCVCVCVCGSVYMYVCVFVFFHMCYTTLCRTVNYKMGEVVSFD